MTERGYLHVRVTPGALANEVNVSPDGALNVHVIARAREGQANKAACHTLADTLQVPKSHVSVVRGLSSRHKTIEVLGISTEALQRRAGIRTWEDR